MSTLLLSGASTAASAQESTGGGFDRILFMIIVVFILSVFLGIELISRVPTTLHTPLMSGTNAIHGIILVGGMLVVGAARDNMLLLILGFIAVVFGAGNVVGGFVVTDRMLLMFNRKRPDQGGKK